VTRYDLEEDEMTTFLYDHTHTQARHVQFVVGVVPGNALKDFFCATSEWDSCRLRKRIF
jgi:hypothetical protein